MRFCALNFPCVAVGFFVTFFFHLQFCAVISFSVASDEVEFEYSPIVLAYILMIVAIVVKIFQICIFLGLYVVRPAKKLKATTLKTAAREKRI